jgi:hypothetical protein
VKRKPGLLDRLLSFNHQRKRIGASRLVFADPDVTAMKTRLVEVPQGPVVRGADKSLAKHLANLEHEFGGQPVLCYHHARLIVLIRRKVKLNRTVPAFLAIWRAEAPFLCCNLNTRWLTSAADTIAEHDPDPLQRSLALATSVLINTVKIYETERHVTGADSLPPDQGKIDEFGQILVPLADGMSAFVVGTDDTLRNLHWRMEPMFDEGPAGMILKTVDARMQRLDTAFARLRSLHKRDKTAWWDDD